MAITNYRYITGEGMKMVNPTYDKSSYAYGCIEVFVIHQNQIHVR